MSVNIAWRPMSAPVLPVCGEASNSRAKSGNAPVRRRIVSLYPLLATAILTAAIFLLPATGDHQRAAAWVDDMSVSATHIGNTGINPHNTTRR